MVAEFKAQRAEYGGWRRDFCFLLRLFSQWLKDNALLDEATQDRIKRLNLTAHSKNVTFAYVASSQGGIADLMNALFFAACGQQIKQVQDGRTSKCMIEIRYIPECPPHLRLLPIHTCLQTLSIDDWREAPEAWTGQDLDIADSDPFARIMERVSETIQVTRQEAHALGLLVDKMSTDPGAEDAHALVDIPKWRYAQINLQNPLLELGMVVLMAPERGFTLESERMKDLMEQAHVFVLTLNADRGISASELAMWKEQLAPRHSESVAALVVLDTASEPWDGRSDDTKAPSQLAAQKIQAAKMLGIEPDRAIGVATHSAIAAIKSKQAELLEKSGLTQFEAVLVRTMLQEQQQLLHKNLRAGLADLQASVAAAIENQLRDLGTKQAALQAMRDKSQQLLYEMRHRLTHEQRQFAQARGKIAAFECSSRKLFQKINEQLRPQQLNQEMGNLAEFLTGRGLRGHVKQLYNNTFDRLQNQAKVIQATANELRTLQDHALAQLTADYGFILSALGPADLAAYQIELELARHIQVTGAGFRHAVRLKYRQFAKTVVRAMSQRLEQLQASVRADVHQWRSSLVAQLKAHSASKRDHIARQLQSIKTIESVTDGLDQRLMRLDNNTMCAKELRQKLEDHAANLNAAISEIRQL